MNVDFHILIPARLDSTRLPQKALADIAGRPLIVHVLERALASGASSVQVATDSDRIAEAVRAAGGRVVMTAPGHRSGTDRLAEAAELGSFSDQDIVVNLQGDEPGMPASCLQQVAALLAADPDASMATLWQAIESTREWSDPNVVKLVVDNLGRALYFSRAPIPHSRDAGWPRTAGPASCRLVCLSCRCAQAMDPAAGQSAGTARVAGAVARAAGRLGHRHRPGLPIHSAGYRHR